jgi:3',5'-nucleoside bisphosphate phosphatase
MMRQVDMTRRLHPASGSAFVDLHLHTVHSDGTRTPEAVVGLAHQARLSAIAITDHDSLAGIAAGANAAASCGIELIPGVELSASEGRSDVHILGYFMNPATPGLDQELGRLRDGRRDRAERIVARLDELGVSVSLDRVLEIAGTGAIGRPHIATALVENGRATSIEDAFDRFLGYRGPAYVPKRALAPADAIALVRGAGGVAVLAHPGSLRRDDLIPNLKAMGLHGLEVWHPKHDAGRVAHYTAMAAALGLLVTGGSDYHGGGRGESEVGGQPVPSSVLAPLIAQRDAAAR